MKKKISYYFLTFLLAGCTFHSKAPDISINTSKGIVIKDKLYFMINYKLFARPVGIATFPDGGKSKVLLNEYHIIEYQKNKKQLKSVSSFKIQKKDLKISSLKLSKEGTVINFLVSFSVQDPSRSIWGKNLYKFNIENNKLEIIPDYKGGFKPTEDSELIARKEINKLFNYVFNYNKIGLKDPLDFINKSDKTLKNIIYNKQGNEKFRIAVLGYIISKNKLDILAEIKKKTPSERTKQIIDSISHLTDDLNGDLKMVKQ